ncbi:MAG: SLBB domain-containing protein [Terracidiphilus sp.]|jgi:protein involved in polysaccharide export with SLBB domain
MRNHPSSRSFNCRATLLQVAGAVLLVFFAQQVLAQCSSGEDSDSYGCQLQQSAPLPSTVPSQASSTVLSMQEQPQQGPPRPDLSTQTFTDNGPVNGSHDNEAALRNAIQASGQRAARLFAPEPHTEFQRFVADSTGHMLTIYGASLFAQRPASFGPIDQAPAPQDLVVGTGDELRIRIWGQINFSANLRVSREGEIYLPKVGAVHVAGLAFSSVTGHLRTALERVYRNFDLSVDLGEIHSIQVYVTGQARQPGEYTVSALSTLVDAVFLSGGPSGAGSMRHAELKREGKILTDFDLYALLVSGDKTGDVQLQPGDVLFIPAAGPEVALLGSVRQEAIYELRGQESVEQLLDAAGGRTAVASGGHILVERIMDHTERRAFDLKADAAGLATLLVDGDIVRINPIASNYRETVTLRGSVANPGRFLWHQGMRLSDLMPDRDSLLSRNYWWRRTQLGFPAPEFVSTDSSSTSYKEKGLLSERSSGDDSDEQSEYLSNPLSDRNANSLSDRRLTPSSVDDPSAAMQKAIDNRASGAAGTLGGILVNSRMGQETALLRPSSETDWNYAVIERLDASTMATSLIPFDLGKLMLDHDPSQNMELQPGDIVTIFSQDDIHQPTEQQTKYVRLEGEFVHAGIYSVLPNESLRELVARAGGLTGKAYLYGSEFTRKSTQVIEQQRLNEYADHLEHQMARSSMAMSSAASSSPESGQSGQAASVNHDLIARLRQLRPTGRIVLSLHPRSSGDNELPDMPLEDGDVMLVPPTPATVQVIGAVLNQNAFLYRNDGHVSDYLHLAGGPSRDADRKHSYVLRADGSVTSRDTGQSIFSASGFDRTRVYPGDTIFVPEKSVGQGALHELLGWTQIFSQLALGAAAIDVLK